MKFYSEQQIILLIYIIVWHNVTDSKLSDYRKNDRVSYIQTFKFSKSTEFIVTLNSFTCLRFV